MSSGRCLGPMSTVSFSPNSFADEFDTVTKSMSDGKLLRLRQEIEDVLERSSVAASAGGSSRTIDVTDVQEGRDRRSAELSPLLAQLSAKLTDAFFAMPLSRCLAIGCCSAKVPDRASAKTSSTASGGTQSPQAEEESAVDNSSFFADDLVSIEAAQQGNMNDERRKTQSRGSNDAEDDDEVEECITLNRYDVLYYAVMLQASCAGSPLLSVLGDPSDFLRRSGTRQASSGASNMSSRSFSSAMSGEGSRQQHVAGVQSEDCVCWWVAASVTAFRQPLSSLLVLSRANRTKRWIEIGYDVWRSCPSRVDVKLLQLLTIYAETILNNKSAAEASEASRLSDGTRLMSSKNSLRDEKIFTSVSGGGNKMLSINMIVREVAERMTVDAVRKHWSKIRPALHNGSTTVHCRTLRGWNRYFLLYHHHELQLDPATVADMVRDIWSNPTSKFSSYAANFLMRHEYFTSLFVPTAVQLATAFPQCPFMPALAAAAIVASCRAPVQLPQLYVEVNAHDAAFRSRLGSGDALAEGEKKRGDALGDCAEDDDDSTKALDARVADRKTLFDAKVLLQHSLEIEPSFPYAWASLKSVLTLIRQQQQPPLNAPGVAAERTSSSLLSSPQKLIASDSSAIVHGKTFDADACEDMYERSDVPASMAFPALCHPGLRSGVQRLRCCVFENAFADEAKASTVPSLRPRLLRPVLSSNKRLPAESGQNVPLLLLARCGQRSRRRRGLARSTLD